MQGAYSCAVPTCGHWFDQKKSYHTSSSSTIVRHLRKQLMLNELDVITELYVHHTLQNMLFPLMLGLYYFSVTHFLFL